MYSQVPIHIREITLYGSYFHRDTHALMKQTYCKASAFKLAK